MSNVLGSIFLGDNVRHRVYSPSPPPSPAAHPSSASATERESKSGSAHGKVGTHEQHVDARTPINPELSLELRIRWLECLLHGVRQDTRGVKKGRKSLGPGDEKEKKKKDGKNDVLVRKAEEVQKKLDKVVQSNDGLRKFMDRYDQHAQILTPSFALSGSTAPPSYDSMTPEELDALLQEMEPDIKAADRDLREIDVLEKRGVLAAGKLEEFAAFKPRLVALEEAHSEDLEKAADLERRIANVLRQYATRIDALSELFVEWNDVLSAAEDKTTRLEREKAEKARLGLIDHNAEDEVHDETE